MTFIQQPAEKTQYTKKYDVFHNADDRELIKEFDRQYGHMGFFPALVALGLASYSEMYPEGAINEFRMEEVLDVQEKFRACNDLMKMAEYAKEQERLMGRMHTQLELIKSKIAV